DSGYAIGALLAGFLIDSFSVGGAIVTVGDVPVIYDVRKEITEAFPHQVSSRIRLTIDPALSPQDVAEEYRRARDEIWPGRHRSLSRKHLRLARFHAERAQEASWKERLHRWNRGSKTVLMCKPAVICR
ncbi:MAG: hypothetical protein IID32_07000, partial [Planctomycetes bacterium]|nr:hypothetical protein [Planctomycetota bacterium]